MALPVRSLLTSSILIALAGAVPWAAIVIATGGTWIVLACCLVSALAAFALYRALRPASQAAAVLRTLQPELFRADASQAQSLLENARQLVDRVHALEHRWVRRHAITGLPIRESLLERVESRLDRGSGATIIGAIRIADYRRLSAFDPDAAELAIKTFADRLTLSLAPNRFLAHVDRDCFAFLFEDASAEAAQGELAALCYALGAEIVADSIAFIPEIDMGMAIYPDDAASAAALLNVALMSLSKGGGGTRQTAIHIADDARERFTIEQGLRLAVERHELQLHFQPVVDLSRGILVGGEALLRWRHPSIGLIEPARFIPVLEDSDLMHEIGMWALNEACREARHWRKNGQHDLKVAVNLSARQLHDGELSRAIERTLARHRLPANALELELTETAAAKDAGRTRQIFGALRTLGVSIAIDDFGSGYSSLSYLKNLPFDKLKIDREFVCEVDRRRDSQAICRSLIELSRGLGIAVLAEGVETLEEVETLQRLGCTIFQGYYFSRPLAPEDFLLYALHPDGRRGRRDARDRQDSLMQRVG